MAANKEPIYPKEPDMEGLVLTVADSSLDGTTVVNALFPRAANHPTVNGAKVDRIIATPAGVTTGDAQIAIFLNNGGAWTNSANNRLIHGLYASSGGYQGQEFPVNITIPPGHRLGCVINSSGTVNWSVVAEGGIY